MSLLQPENEGVKVRDLFRRFGSAGTAQHAAFVGKAFRGDDGVSAQLGEDDLVDGCASARTGLAIKFKQSIEAAHFVRRETKAGKILHWQTVGQ